MIGLKIETKIVISRPIWFQDVNISGFGRFDLCHFVVVNVFVAAPHINITGF